MPTTPPNKLSFLSLAVPRPTVLIPSHFSPARRSSVPFTRTRLSSESLSWSSADDEPAVSPEWTPQQLAVISATLEESPSQLGSPFNGSIPPSNMLDRLGKAIIKSHTSDAWPHTHRATRAMLLQVAKKKAEEERELRRHTMPTRSPARRVPLYRQSSMDFITSERVTPDSSRLLASLSMTRSERAPFHPYQRPVTRSRSTTSPLSPRASSESFASASTATAGPIRRRRSSAKSSDGTVSHQASLSSLASDDTAVDSALDPDPMVLSKSARRTKRTMSDASDTTSSVNNTKQKTKAAPSYTRVVADPFAPTEQEQKRVRTRRQTVDAVGPTQNNSTPVMISPKLRSTIPPTTPPPSSYHPKKRSGSGRLARKRSRDDENIVSGTLGQVIGEDVFTSGNVPVPVRTPASRTTKRVRKSVDLDDVDGLSRTDSPRRPLSTAGSLSDMSVMSFPIHTPIGSPSPSYISLDGPQHPNNQHSYSLRPRLRRVANLSVRPTRENTPLSPISPEASPSSARPRMIGRKISFGGPLHAAGSSPGFMNSGLASPFDI